MLQGRLKEEKKIQRSIGRLLERYPRVARYYEISYDATQKSLSWSELVEKKAKAQKLDGSYVLKTDRQDLTAEEIWRTYILLTRVEDAFCDTESPLMERRAVSTNILHFFARVLCPKFCPNIWPGFPGCLNPAGSQS